MNKIIASCGLALAVIAHAANATADPKSFPGAEGFGANAKGGRGGVIYEVTNLNDSGDGSLRACIEATEPRTCVFRVSGTIRLNTSITGTAPYLTIAGQTAPGDGIALRLESSMPRAETPIIIMNTHDVIIRHIRSRPGVGQRRAATDAIMVQGSKDVILDHVSMSWSMDENFNAHEGVENLTVQWSIMAEGLLEHSKGSLTCSHGFVCKNLTLHHNLYVSNRDRNPDVKSSSEGHVDVINNVIHNPSSAYVEVWAKYGDFHVNIVGNSFLKGPSTTQHARAVRYNIEEATGRPVIYLNDNVAEVPLIAEGTEPFVVEAPNGELSITPEPPADAAKQVLEMAGAWPRDALDQRLVRQVQKRKGKLIRDPLDNQGWPVLNSTDAPPDRDNDGMPDDWESAHGLDPSNGDDRNSDPDGDGYTALEQYLDERARSLIGVNATGGFESPKDAAPNGEP